MMGMETHLQNSGAIPTMNSAIRERLPMSHWRDLARRARFDVRGLASLPEVSLSVRSLQRLFESRFSAPPSHCLFRWRAEEARDYIVATASSNKEAAYQFGFSDEAHICHAFQQLFHRTPQSFSPKREPGDYKLQVTDQSRAPVAQIQEIVALIQGPSLGHPRKGSKIILHETPGFTDTPRSKVPRVSQRNNGKRPTHLVRQDARCAPGGRDGARTTTNDKSNKQCWEIQLSAALKTSERRKARSYGREIQIVRRHSETARNRTP